MMVFFELRMIDQVRQDLLRIVCLAWTQEKSMRLKDKSYSQIHKLIEFQQKYQHCSCYVFCLSGNILYHTIRVQSVLHFYLLRRSLHNVAKTDEKLMVEYMHRFGVRNALLENCILIMLHFQSADCFFPYGIQSERRNKYYIIFFRGHVSRG